MSRLVVARVVVTAALVAGCSLGGDPSGPATPAPGDPGVSNRPLVVFAAASLRDAVDEAVRRFEDIHPGVIVQVNVGSSTALRTQIEQGARVDVFLSADEANAAALVGAGLAPGPPVEFARTSLSIVVPIDDPAGISSPLDLGRPGLKIIAAGDAVPLTAYATRAVEALGTTPGYPPDFATSVVDNIVTREPDARAVVTKVELGEGDAAIVYTTDARRSRHVRIIEIPAPANVTVSYAGLVLTAALRGDDARAFIAWLSGPEGQAVLVDLGFEVGP